MLQRRNLLLAGLAAALSLVAPRATQADFGNFNYGSQVTPSPIYADPSSGATRHSMVTQAGVGNFTTPTTPAFGATTTAGTDISVGSIQVTDLGTGAFRDTYGPTSVLLAVRIEDVDSKSMGLFTFVGNLVGTVSSSGVSDSLSFKNPFVSPMQETQQIGTTYYTVSIDPTKSFSAPGNLAFGGSSSGGLYSVHVHASNTPVAPLPEPGSIALLGLGAVGALGVVRRQRAKS